MIRRPITRKERRRIAKRMAKAATIFKKNARRAWGWCNTVPGRRRMKSKRLYWFSMVNRIKCELVIWESPPLFLPSPSTATRSFAPPTRTSPTRP